MNERVEGGGRPMSRYIFVSRSRSAAELGMEFCEFGMTHFSSFCHTTRKGLDGNKRASNMIRNNNLSFLCEIANYQNLSAFSEKLLKFSAVGRHENVC